MGNNSSSGFGFTKLDDATLLSDKWARRKRLGAALVGAEVTSIAMMGASAVIGRTFFPHQLESLENTIAEKIVAPNLDSIEKYANNFSALEGAEGAEKRKNMTRDERSKYFAHGMVHYSIPIAFGILGQGLGQAYLDKKMGLPELGKTPFERGRKIAFATVLDRGVQVGSFMLLNSQGSGQDLNEAMQHKVANMLVNLPFVNKDSADFTARYLVNWQVPNMLGMITSIGSLDRAYGKQLKELVVQPSAAK